VATPVEAPAAPTRPDSNRSRIRLGRLKAAQQRRVAGLSHSRTAHRVEAHRLSVQCSGLRVDRGSQPGLDATTRPDSNRSRIDRGRIAARCRDGAIFEADAAILTVPLPLLSEIVLPSPARERVAATADIGFGNVVKILLRFRTKWWADHGGRDLADLSFLLSDAAVPTWWTQHPAGYPVLTGWFAGPKADTVSSLTARELVDMGVASLAEIFDLPLDRIRRDLVASRADQLGRRPVCARGLFLCHAQNAGSAVGAKKT
jgi:hypothetical protein